MIARHWRGVARPERADEYVEHLRRVTLPELARIEGFISATIMRRSVAEGIEFLIVTFWDSLEAIARFAGPELERAVVPDSVRRMMIEFEPSARHYEVVAT
jgi:heme-degrading monooxygenase HmoA